MLSPPSCPTRSIWRKPGSASFHSRQVFIGIEDLSIEPGRVWLIGLRATNPTRASARRRSIVAGDIVSSWAMTSCSMPSRCPWVRMLATKPGSAGCSRLPVGPSNAAQQRSSSAMTSGP